MLTEEVGYPPSPLANTGSQSARTGGGRGTSFGPTVTKALQDVLGWKIKPGDAKGFMGALNQSFQLKMVEGAIVSTWTPRSYAVRTNLNGGITGAQASIYTMAKTLLDQSLPLIDGICALDPAADAEYVAAAKDLVTSQLMNLTADRVAAYRRVFGYGGGSAPAGARPNTDFHALFTHFIQQVTLFWRDKRISDVIRERAYDPGFGSIAIVRRAGLDLRNNLKWLSFGDVNVLRVEVMQLLEEAFKILDAPDVKNQSGADNAWDVVEEVLIRYYNERLTNSPRRRMGATGREVLRWLAQPHILTTTRAQFETLLLEIAENAEEWLTSGQAMQLADREAGNRVLPWTRSAPITPPTGRPPLGRDRRTRRICRKSPPAVDHRPEPPSPGGPGSLPA
jgi:hypothetical protein